MRQKKSSHAKHLDQAPSPGSLAALAALGACSALWALFLWEQLVLARSGGTSFCAAGEGPGCAEVWDSSFATAIHRFTGLPIAGWGLVWGVAAFAFPLLSLLRLAQGRRTSTLVWAGRWMAVSGVVVVVVTIAVSLLERSFCIGCAIIYVLVLGYASLTLGEWQQMSFREARRSLALAAGANLVVFLLLLYPGLRTPQRFPSDETGEESSLTHSAAPAAFSPPRTIDPERDRQIIELVGSLAPPLKQTLSDSLHVYRTSPQLTLPPPRVLLGASKAAPVRITEFTDVLCSHCAKLYMTLKSLREHLPPGSFTIEPRQYPLDSRCNPSILTWSGRSARCLAAVAQICLEKQEKAFEFSGKLFENQRDLTEEKVFQFAAPYLSRPDLERCIGSQETKAKLEDDIELANRFRARGTPLVVVNGRRGTSFGPFLHVMILSGGAAFHPALKALPAPNSRVELH